MTKPKNIAAFIAVALFGALGFLGLGGCAGQASNVSGSASDGPVTLSGSAGDISGTLSNP